MATLFGPKGVGAFTRRRSLFALGAAAAIVVPVAVAVACVPAASIGFNSSSYRYSPGDTVVVTGRGFVTNTQMILTLSPPGREVGNRVSTDTNGNFTDSFRLAPDTPHGTYVVEARANTSGEASGGGMSGGATKAVESLTVGPPREVLVNQAISSCKKKYSTKRVRGSTARKRAAARKRMIRKRQQCIRTARETIR